jgi:threonine synthase
MRSESPLEQKERQLVSQVFCPECHAQDGLSPQRFRCQCGGAWEFDEIKSFEPKAIEVEDSSIWRYRKLFGLHFQEPVVRLGAGNTPLLPAVLDGQPVSLKLEYFAPTGSFKDRGTSVMVNILSTRA